MEFDEIDVKVNPGICRCCLSEGCYKELSSEYSWMTETEVYADMLLDCFDISISQHNEGPNGAQRLICEVCITRLRDACNFKKQVLESEKKFVDMLSRGDFRPKVMVFEDSMKEEKHDEDIGVINEVEVEYLDEDMDYVDDTEYLQTETDIDQPSVSKDTTSKLQMKVKRGRPRKSPELKPEKKIKVTKTKVEEKIKKSAVKGAKYNTVEDLRKKSEMERKLLIKRRNILYVLSYGNVTPFLWSKARYRCFFCTEPMRDPDVLREHTAKVHQFANLELVIYDRMKSNRNKEAAVKIDITDISCKLCNKTVNNFEEFIHHLIIAHDAEYDTSITNCILPFQLCKDNPSCPICDMRFTFFEYLLRHANKYHLSHDYICDVCGTSFQGENYLKMHNRYYHKEGGYTCKHCGITLSTLSKKVLHDKNVHSINLSTCAHCPETFKSPYLKKLHLANVHGVEEMKIKCPYCPKVYPQESIMSRHMRRVHLREKNVECAICSEKFFSSYDVKLHMTKHNGDKKFICTACGKRFAKKHNLTSHLITHTGIKRHVCGVCGKAFSHSTSLKMHYESKHEGHDRLEHNKVIDVTEKELMTGEYVQTALTGSVEYNSV